MKILLTVFKCFLLLCLSVFFSQAGHANDLQELNNSELPLVGAPWNSKTISQNYNHSNPVIINFSDRMLGYILFSSGFNFMAEALVDSRSEQEVVENIGNICLQKYDNQWALIKCAMDNVKSLLAKIKWGKNGFIKGSRLSFCRAHAHTFKQVVEYMKIPNVAVEFQEASFSTQSGQRFSHVVNRLFVNVNGIDYAYVTDVGLYTGILHPLSPSSIEYQKAHAEENFTHGLPL